ncbi:diguanylate cyclase/phosphodiesterase (GGDEF & EAL domains) with PAS/PAC sensor(s) [hydrothermal vent metagenome]|uniref:Diguanylate cyclase/phosphodiesterase (GGDEF & EAL domains) with PAS/PAC sensor(S) n=1 Tax=hydrothermal vent metagenome TaxID=652676 RepID=A0A3B0WTQ5_9ZZZZ
MSLPKLIVIDDEADMAKFVCDVAKQAGFDAEQYNNAAVFKRQYNKNADAIVLDLMMPGIDGVEIIRFLSEVKCDAHLILMSGFDSGVLHSAQKLALEQGLRLSGSLNKPFRAREINKLLGELAIIPKNERAATAVQQPTLKELKNALVNNELIVYYQPKVGLNEGAIAAVEALVRWQHPVYGLTPPNLFIPMAEQHGLIDELTWVVLDQAMTQCKLWRDQNLIMQVAINMSASTIKELDLPEKMGRLIQKHSLEPSQIVLEITESALMQELVKSLDILTRLRMKGIHLSIDDFGTGYSSLVQLHRAPFSEIKVDQSFVSEMEFDSEAATIVETIIMLGHKLNMKSVAEGVETTSCLKKLADLDCDKAQGYLYSKPMPGNDVFTWFSEHPPQEHFPG